MILLLAQGLVVYLFLYPLLGRAVGIRSFSWDLTNHESERVHALIVCDILHISLSPLPNYSNVGQALYTFLAFDAGGFLTATQINGLWQVRHRRGSQPIPALLDSLRISGGIPPTIFTIASGSSQCLPTTLPPSVIPAVTTNATHLEHCGSWHLSITGGIPPYTIILASLGTPTLQYLTATQGSSTFSLINNAIKLRGSAIVVVRDSFGMFARATDFVESTDDGGMSCKVEKPQGSVRKLNIIARSSGGVKVTHQDTIIVVVCASVGGTMILAALCFAVVMFRRRKRLVAGQDARPRPFDITIPASRTNTLPPRVNVSVPLSVIDISWRNNRMASPTDTSSARSPVGPTSPRTHVRQFPVQTASRQPSKTSLYSPVDSRSQPPRKPCNSSMNVIGLPQACTSSRPPRQQQSISSMRSANRNCNLTNLPLPVQHSTPVQEGKLSKSQPRSERHRRLLHPSRSAGDIHGDNMAHPHQQHRTMPHSTSDVHNLNQLRSYYSTSNIRHADRRMLEGEVFYQRHETGDPPPYRKLGPSGLSFCIVSARIMGILVHSTICWGRCGK